METTRELSVVPQQGMMTKMGIINPTFIEDAVIVSEKKQEKEHPNFIESNTSGITLELYCTQLWRQPAYNQPPDFYTPY